MHLLTTSEAADYLKLSERKLYELVADGDIPCTKMTGKWLFPRNELDRWLLSGLNRPAGVSPADPPPIMAGSQDALLEWSLRESGSGLASLTEGTEAGVARVVRGEALAAAIHYHRRREVIDPAAFDANVEAIRKLPGMHDAVIIGFVRREQGLLVQPGNPMRLNSLADVITSKATMAVRQSGAGAQMLLDALLQSQGHSTADLPLLSPPCLTGPDLATAIRARKADCGIATRAAARAAGLDFIPLAWEHFDLVMRQRSFFRKEMQSLLQLTQEQRFGERAMELSGYDISPAGTVRYFS